MKLLLENWEENIKQFFRGRINNKQFCGEKKKVRCEIFEQFWPNCSKIALSVRKRKRYLGYNLTEEGFLNLAPDAYSVKCCLC